MRRDPVIDTDAIRIVPEGAGPPDGTVQRPNDGSHKDLIGTVQLRLDPVDQRHGTVQKQGQGRPRHLEGREGADKPQAHGVGGGHAVVAGCDVHGRDVQPGGTFLV